MRILQKVRDIIALRACILLFIHQPVSGLGV